MGQVLISSLWLPVIGPKGVAWGCLREGSCQASAHSTKPEGVQEASDSALRHMMSFLDGPLRSQELDSVILVDAFQLRIFYSIL